MSTVITKFVKNKAKKAAKKAAESVASTVVGAVVNYGKKKKRRNKNQTKKYIKDGRKVNDPRDRWTFQDMSHYNQNIVKPMSTNSYERGLYKLLTDPFGCQRAMRLAWDSSICTAIMTVSYRGLITAGNDGQWIFTLLPSLNYPLFYKAGNGDVGFNNWSQYQVIFPSGLDNIGVADSYRFISMGMKVRCLTPANSASGLFSSVVQNTDAYETPFWDYGVSNWKQTHTPSELFQDSTRSVSDMINPVEIHWRPHFSNEFDFNPTYAANQHTWDTYHTQCSIAVHAAGGSQKYECEIVGHLEWMPDRFVPNVYDLQAAQGTRDASERVIRRLRDNTNRSGFLTRRSTSGLSLSKDEEPELVKKESTGAEVTISQEEYLELKKLKAKN